MRSTYAVHLSILESIAMNAEANRRQRALSAILESRARERARASRRMWAGLAAFLILFIVGCIVLPAPTL